MVHHTMYYYGATIKNEVGGWKDGSVAKNVYCYSRRPELHSQNPYWELTSQKLTSGRNSSPGALTPHAQTYTKKSKSIKE